MVALTNTETSNEPATSPASLRTAPISDPHYRLQQAAEKHFLRCVLIGMGVGMVVCAGVWLVIVTLAMIISDSPLGPMMAVGVGCGLFAGIFLGGAAGASAGVKALEHAEHVSLPPIS